MSARPRFAESESIIEERYQARGRVHLVDRAAPGDIACIAGCDGWQEPPPQMRVRTVGGDEHVTLNWAMPVYIGHYSPCFERQVRHVRAHVVAVHRKRGAQREIDGLPGGELLRCGLRLPVAPSRIEISSYATGGGWKLGRVVVAQQRREMWLHHDPGSPSVHRTRLALEHIHVCTDPVQGKAGAQSANRAAGDCDFQRRSGAAHESPAAFIRCASISSARRAPENPGCPLIMKVGTPFSPLRCDAFSASETSSAPSELARKDSTRVLSI